MQTVRARAMSASKARNAWLNGQSRALSALRDPRITDGTKSPTSPAANPPVHVEAGDVAVRHLEDVAVARSEVGETSVEVVELDAAAGRRVLGVEQPTGHFRTSGNER